MGRQKLPAFSLQNFLSCAGVVTFAPENFLEIKCFYGYGQDCCIQVTFEMKMCFVCL